MHSFGGSDAFGLPSKDALGKADLEQTLVTARSAGPDLQKVLSFAFCSYLPHSGYIALLTQP